MSIKGITIDGKSVNKLTLNGGTVYESGDVPEVYHTVTFVMGGHGTQVEPQTVVSGETATQPTAPTADGWDFIGWFSDSGFTSAFSFSTPITADITLYAKWVEQSAPDVLLSWEHVFWSIEQGSYATDYSIGDLIPLDLGAEGNINMQIAAFNADDLASGSGKAHISFISKELLNTSHRMNPDRSGSSGAYDEGTGSIGGWEKSEMRAYLKNTVKPLIPSAVRSAIVEVTKTQASYDSAGSSETQTTQDDVWLPAWNEIKSSSAMYGTLFPDNASRIKYNVGAPSASYWWTRQGYLGSNFSYVSTSGSTGNRAPSDSYGVALGFCL